MLERTNQTGETIMMLRVIIKEMVRFFSTFGIIIIIYLFIGRFLGELIVRDISDSEYGSLFNHLFNALTGNPEFIIFSIPYGEIYITTFLLIFRLTLMSLLVSIFINKYMRVYANLDAIKRSSIIELKNSITYDKYVGALTCSFFPINSLVMPFIIPILKYRSQKISESLLKF
jgi:hypothetical protein